MRRKKAPQSSILFQSIAFATPRACSRQRGFDAGAFALNVVVLELCRWVFGGEVGGFVFEFLMAAFIAFDFFSF